MKIALISDTHTLHREVEVPPCDILIHAGESQPQLRITKEGDAYLRMMLVQGAHYILGHRGPDTGLKRFGLKLAARGGKRAKKAAVIAVARK